MPAPLVASEKSTVPLFAPAVDVSTDATNVVLSDAPSARFEIGPPVTPASPVALALASRPSWKPVPAVMSSLVTVICCVFVPPIRWLAMAIGSGVMTACATW